MILGGVAGSLAVHGCKPKDEAESVVDPGANPYPYNYARTPEEKERIMELEAEEFFNQHELATLTVLSSVILPANESFGSAADAGVPHFIEFMAKDIPEMQTLLRGGLMWLDHTCNKQFGIEFKSASPDQHKQILDPIAFYDPTVALTEQPLEIQFFALMRNLTLTGYYTSKMGIEDLGYKGNTPNVWDGVPQEVLEQHGVAYDEEWLAKCVDQSKRNVIAEWDDEGNLIT